MKVFIIESLTALSNLTMMKNISLLLLSILTIALFVGCSEMKTPVTKNIEYPSFGHDLSYIPFDESLDHLDYNVCDSTKMGSGRNRLQYVGGNKKLKDDIISKFDGKEGFENFNGYIVVRFLVNCLGKSGRYRAQTLNLDFSPSDVSSDLAEYSVGLIKGLDNWTKSASNGPIKEYSKYINLKIHNGQIQHVLL